MVVSSVDALNPLRMGSVDHSPVLLRRIGRSIAQARASRGWTQEVLAAALDISIYTVDAHRGRIMKKLALRSLGELVKFAMRKGLVT